MKEIILVEENEQFKGAMSSVKVSVEDGVVLPSNSTMEIAVPFAFKNISPVNLQLSCGISYKLALLGLSITSHLLGSHYLNLVIHNSSGEEVTLHSDNTLAEIQFTQSGMLKAVDTSKTGVIDLNLGVGEALEETLSQ